MSGFKLTHSKAVLIMLAVTLMFDSWRGHAPARTRQEF